MRRMAGLGLWFAAAALLAACYGESIGTGGSTSTSGSSSSSSSGAGGTTSSGAGGTTSSASGGGGAGGSAPELLEVDAVLAALRADRDGTLLAHSAGGGWPLQTKQGWLFVSTDAGLSKLAGDHDQWTPEAMTPDQGFAWIVEASIPNDDHYKFTDGQTWVADPWSRSVDYDSFGEISIARATAARLDRWFGVGDAKLQKRTVRVWVPGGAITHELYVHDGQNLFDPAAIWGGWHLSDTVPAGMLLVGIDNTSARMDEYTHVSDVIEAGGSSIGGKGDDYAAFLQTTVRPLIRAHYGEPGPVGVMGSSLGGLISFEIAHQYPDEYAFAASLSGTMGWGSIGAMIHNETMIERYDGVHQAPFLYLDSGGDDGGGPCLDSDGDGIDDDSPSASDNFCENAQMKQTLLDAGYHAAPEGGPYQGFDLFYWHEPAAEHNEAAWAARVFRPLQIFSAL